MKHQLFELGPVPSQVKPYERPTVLGLGSWGTALASTLADNGTKVRIWGRRSEAIDNINRDHRNDHYIPDVTLPASLSAVSDIDKAVRGADVILIVVPSRALRSVSRPAQPHTLPSHTLHSLTLYQRTPLHSLTL